MGFRFRRTIRIVPGVRLNVSRSGTSISLGGRGFHSTVGPKGTRTTVGLPGSGLSWTSYRPYTTGRQPQFEPSSTPDSAITPSSIDPEAIVFESAALEQLISGSTSELAPILDAVRKRWRFHPIVLVLALSAVALAVASNSPPAIIGAIVFAAIAWPAAAILDRHRLTITLDYDLQDNQLRRFDELVQQFQGLTKCRQVWRVTLECRQTDKKRNAGASHSVQRQVTALRTALPDLIKSNLKFPSIPVGKKTIYFAPDAVLIVARRSVAALDYDDFEIDARRIKYIEDARPPRDAAVVGTTWQYVNKGGGPDRRFSNNRRLPICVYGEMDMKSSSGFNERIQCSHAEAMPQFASSIVAMRQPQQFERVQGEITQVSTDQLPPALQKIADRLEIRVVNYEPVPGKTTWNCKFVFTCRKCGGQSIRLSDDLTDESNTSCQTCGEEFGRFGDIKALSNLIGQRELLKRVALGNSSGQPELNNCGAAETTKPKNRRKWGAFGVLILLAIVAGILGSREAAQKLITPAAPIAASDGKSGACAEWAKAGINLKQCYEDGTGHTSPQADAATQKRAVNGAVASITPAEADVKVQCQMGSSCLYQKVLSRALSQHSSSTTVINARIRSCFKDFGPPNEKTGRYPVPSHYSCKLSDDINTDYVVASCNRNAPFVGGYDFEGRKMAPSSGRPRH